MQFHYADRNPSDYEEDHLVSLELGSAPRSTRNLWPQPWSQARRDDNGIEARLHRKLCDGTLTLRRAQAQEIAYKHRLGWVVDSLAGRRPKDERNADFAGPSRHDLPLGAESAAPKPQCSAQGAVVVLCDTPGLVACDGWGSTDDRNSDGWAGVVLVGGVGMPSGFFSLSA